MVLGYVDLAITGTLEYERYAGVYVGPWWPVEDVPDGMHVWKRSVLRRIIGRGAEHWGHLYLVVRSAEQGSLSWFRRDWRGRTRAVQAPDYLVLRRGEQTAELTVRPSTVEQHEVLEGFAREITERFRRQMD